MMQSAALHFCLLFNAAQGMPSLQTESAIKLQQQVGLDGVTNSPEMVATVKRTTMRCAHGAWRALVARN